MISLGKSRRNQGISLTISRDHNGYIKGRSALPSGTSSKAYPIACIRRTPKFLFGEALPVHNHLSHKPPTFRLGTSAYADSPKPLEANEATGSGNANTDSGGIQNEQPPPRNPIQGNRQSAFDRIGPGGPTQRPFGGTGSDES
ncbi:hypothetical protein PIB30_088013 [Stylosanthes scabra]|uniref:Microtubule-associated protein Jupiter n=1 Tax=Stylosanthes scabra TaxID=79078 RepID=A0ABU6WUW0_9FABA|nr:hypothetical protein [Stylosanthes scabra]